MNYPLVSVVMPVYNAELYVNDAIRSILNQTYDDIELIIVHDNSTDRTYERLSKIHDNRIILHENNENMGISYSTNKAIELSNGKYIALMDDDDISMPERIEKQVRYMEVHEEIDILGGASEYINEEGNHIKYGNVPRNNPHYIKALLLFRCLDFSNGTTMIRRSFIDENKLKYRDGFYGMQDYQFFIEASKLGNISSISDVLLKYRVHSMNETTLQMNNNAVYRGEKYSKMRRKSLEDSGFVLSKEQYSIIDNAFPETNARSLQKTELNDLYFVLQSIYQQGVEMNIDYLEELRIVLQKLMGEKVSKASLF